jgi:superfamily II DNA or RNA helicase
VLISILSVSLTAFSQTATNSQQTKCFPLPVVRKITKDLLSGDSAKAQLFLTEKQLFETERKSMMKDSVITLLRLKENNYNKIIDAETQKYSILENHTKKVEWNLKKEKIKGKFTFISSVAVILTLTGFLIAQ